MPQAGDRIGPLRIERPLGAGGMGEVFLARDERLERLVAVKLLPESRSLDPAARGRMLREARAASALKHPSIVTVHDIGEQGGLVYIVMEYVDGETFEELVARRGKLPPAEAVELFAQVCDAVAAAHAAGVLHRDLKSANLMTDAEGRVKVLDFGLSKRTDSRAPSESESEAAADEARSEVEVAPTEAPVSAELGLAPTVAPRSGMTVDATMPARSRPSGTSGSFGDDPKTVHGARMGTPGWAAPELIEGRPADVRTDVFALGCVLYHLLAGRPPFPGATWASQREQIAAGPDPLTDVPPALAAVVRTALAPASPARHRDARVMLAAARAAVVKRRRGYVLAALGGVALLGGGAAVAIAMSSGNAAGTGGTPPRDAARRVATSPPPPPKQLTRLDGCAYSPTFLDDDTVVFDLTRDGAVDLYRIDLGGSAPVQLTNDPGWEWRSSRGASATEIVYPHQSNAGAGISTIDVATGARKTLLNETGPVVFARDAYYYSSAGANLLRRRSGERDESFLQLPPARAIDTMVAAHDGSRVAFIMGGDKGMPEICMTEVAKPELVCLPARTSSARVAFSSTNDAIYFDSGKRIWRQPLDGSEASIALADVRAIGGLAVSPAGTALVFSDCAARTILADIIDDPRRSVVNDASASFPDYGPPGVFAYLRSNLSEPTVMLREQTGVVREIYKGKNARLSDLELAPTGCCVAFVSSDAKEGGIFVASTESGASPNRLTEDPGDHAPLFVGDDILFTRNAADGTPHLMKVARDGSAAVRVGSRPRVTLDATTDRVLLGSPAGDYLYWWDPRTGRERPGPRLPDAPALDVTLSPDGKWMLVMAGSAGQRIWRMRSDGTGKPELVRTLAEDLSSMSGAIDDRGHPLIAIDTWAGELWHVPAPAGASW